MSLENISISVVLPVFINKQKNVSDTTKCIELLYSKTNIPFELVIVETCTDYFIDSADIYINEKVKTNPNNSINRAFRSCNTDYVVFIGNDVMVDDLWLESMIECFDKTDCGIATLGTNEHNDSKADSIIEHMYFSICMLKKEDAWFDDFYTYIFDDTDLIFRIYLSGRKCYKSLKSIVFHKPHSTYGKWCGDLEETTRSRDYFRNKYKEHSNNPLYKVLVGD